MLANTMQEEICRGVDIVQENRKGLITVWEKEQTIYTIFKAILLAMVRLWVCVLKYLEIKTKMNFLLQISTILICQKLRETSSIIGPSAVKYRIRLYKAIRAHRIMNQSYIKRSKQYPLQNKKDTPSSPNKFQGSEVTESKSSFKRLQAIWVSRQRSLANS